MGNFKRERKFGRRDSDSSGYGGPRRFSRDSDGPERRDFGRPSLERQMHNVTCDKCGRRCEVPFRPTGGKPVYCSDCFRKNEKFEPRDNDQYKKEFEIINEKLDKILKAMGQD